MVKALDMYNNWLEYVALLFMILAFFMMQVNWLFTGSKVMVYLTIFLAGMIVGRIFYKIKDGKTRFRWSIISLAFLIGFIIAPHYGGRLMLIIVYALGAYASYYIHDKGYLKTVSY